jgi:hypothetical protein
MSIFCFSKNSQGVNYDFFLKPHEIKKPFMRERGKVTIINCIENCLHCPWKKNPTFNVPLQFAIIIPNFS